MANSTLPLYAQVLILVALILFLLLGGAVYYFTSDSWRNRQARRRLGHAVPSLAVTLCRCLVLCLGPMNRRKWEREHRFYRTDDYGQPDGGERTFAMPI